MPRKIKRELFEDLEVVDINSKGAGIVSQRMAGNFVQGVVPGIDNHRNIKKRRGFLRLG